VVEKCWFADKREADEANAPLVCLECPRGKTMQFIHIKSRKTELFLNGFMLACYRIAGALRLNKTLSDVQIKYLLGIEVETKCAIDRGVSVEELEKALEDLKIQIGV